MKGCWEETCKRIKSVGIAGSVYGSGATRLSVALANYAASGLGEKTAYLELNGRHEMSNWKEVNEKGYFTIFSVDYYPDFKKEQIPVLLNWGYEKIMMDFGNQYVASKGELLRCDQKIFLLDLNPWREFTIKKMIETVSQESWGGIKPLYAVMRAPNARKRDIEKNYGIEIAEIPFLPNPMCVQAEAFSFMNAVLGYSVTKRKKSLIPKKMKK